MITPLIMGKVVAGEASESDAAVCSHFNIEHVCC